MNKFKIQDSRFKICLILAFSCQLSAFSCQLSAFCAELDISAAEKSFLEGRYERAIDESNRLVDARSRNRDELYYLKALSELKTGKFKEARRSFEYILERYQKSARTFDAYTGIGDSYLLEGDTGQALKIYGQIINKFPHDNNIGIIYYRIGDCLDRMGQSDKAKDYFDKAESASPLAFERRASQEVKEPRGPVESRYKSPGRRSDEIPQSESGQYISVQVGSFRNKKNAERLTQKLSRAGYDSYIETPAGAGERLYRVKVGRLGSMKEARDLEARLKEDGYRTRVSSGVACER